MTKRYNRTQRIGEVIQTALAGLIQRESEELQTGIITVTGVNVSPDMSYAKIFISVLDEKNADETIKILNDSAKNLRFQLAQAVKLRITPQLKFVYDDSSVRGHRISTLINNSLKNNE